jgi:hypothetical protein
VEKPAEGTIIPIKALVAEKDDPAAPRTEITCGDLPDGLAEAGWYDITAIYAGALPANATPLGRGETYLRVYPSGPMPELEKNLAVSRDAAATMMEYQARKELHADAVQIAQPIRLVNRGDEAGLHYDATYAAPDGRTVSIRVLGGRNDLPTVSINGGPARWPATQPAATKPATTQPAARFR